MEDASEVELEMPKLSEEELEKEYQDVMHMLDTHPAFLKEIDETNTSTWTEALMALKYEETDTKEEKASAYKDEGNYQFKHKLYRVAVENYTEGITTCCADSHLNAVLYGNRGVSHFYLGNYRSSLMDCMCALKFEPDYLKAVIKAAECCLKLKRLKEASTFIQKGLSLDESNGKLEIVRKEVEKAKKIEMRDKRKEYLTSKKQKESDDRMLSVLKSRSVRTCSNLNDCPQFLDSLDSLIPTIPQVDMVHLKDDVLFWPLVFVYPEYSQTDFVNSCSETCLLGDQIAQIFEAGCPPWDENGDYVFHNLEVYFEDFKQNLVHVNLNKTLTDILADDRYSIRGGVPGFIILAKNSFHREFISRYS